ncbi:hypothetical protein [Brevibacillus choshinensis]|uniref:Uncharacterized protein n=1 Tax=Brevibacillus choshinensis TaxID=54911 RepID=A0ABX7FQW0_BRECH|nr:hypothetical protein [Brevibacillus choshinensis]QRG67701.1 hypothetical protein JNE38_00180 [Brevibacillus choshinensis]
MKKILSVSLLTTSLLASSAGIIHAQEAPAKEPKLKQTAEFQQLKTLHSQTKEMNTQLKAQGEKNKAVWDSLKGDVPQEVRDTVKAALAELKPLREENKSLTSQLKEAKQAKDKEKIASIKAQLEANHQTIEAKLAPIADQVAQVKESHKNLKEPLAEVKPIRDAKKANKEEVMQVKQQIEGALTAAKESYKNGDDAWQSSLNDAIDLTEQLNALKSEILSQKTSIYEALQ